MNSFKDFNIKTEEKVFTGDKIKISKILNKPITVHDFKISNSKYPEKGNGECLHLQISVDNEKRSVFTGSRVLSEKIKKVPESGFPFTTTIIEENERYEFS